ncbi:unnamed protein product [Ixodes hexagonus]
MVRKEKSDIRAYVAGFLLRAVLKDVSCKTCKGALTSHSNTQYSTLTKLKEFVRGGGNLTHPSDASMQFLIACEEQFTYTTDILNLVSPFKAIAAILKQNSSVDTGAYSPHRDNVGRLFLERYLDFRLKIHLTQARLEKRGCGLSSKTCSGGNLS